MSQHYPFLFEVFCALCVSIGLAGMLLAVPALIVAAVERVVFGAVLIEAMLEAKKQGRGPILKRWLRIFK